MSHFRNLVFEGGGVKGIAYVGALKVLQQKKVLQDIERVGGTSAGAITAILVGLGYSIAQTEEILWNLDFNKFMDDSWGAVRDTHRLLNEFGWHKGDFFRGWVADRIGEKTGNRESTFADLAVRRAGGKKFADLFFIGTNLTTGYAETFSAEHTPGVAIADAVRISMSIPLFFAARRNFRGDLFVDGGMLNNYPVKLFDRKKYVDGVSLDTRKYYVDLNKKKKIDPASEMAFVYNQETLGFRLDTRKEIDVFRGQSEPPRHKVDDFFDYGGALVRTLLNAQSSQHLHSDDWHRTIYIDTLDVGTTDFDVTDEKKKALVAEGRRSTKAYFDWFDDEDEASWNQPGNEPVE